MIMQVQVLPLRCKADSVFPTCRHGNPARKAGRDGGHPATQRESLLAGAYEERTAKTLKTIVILEQRNGLRRCTQNVNGDMGTGGLSGLPVAFPLPVDCVLLTARSMVIGNVETARILSAMSRQPAAWIQVEGLGQKRMPLCNGEDRLTDPRCVGR